MLKYITLISFYTIATCVVPVPVIETPVTELQSLIEKGNIGVSAGYMVNGNIKWKGAMGYSFKEREVPFEVNTCLLYTSDAADD